MANIIFRGYRVEELDLTNKIEADREIEISQRSQFNVKYTDDFKHCVANLIVDIMDQNNPMEFNYKISGLAYLDCEGNIDQKEIHKLAYEEIFPHVRATTISVMAQAGLPPIGIQKIKIDDSNIEVVEGNKDQFTS